jgi:hypothetical protein
MHTQQKSETFSQTALLQALPEFPASWALTPVYGDKIPYRKDWQSEKPVGKELIVRDIRNRKAKGVGLRTGAVSGGILAVDADGHAAHEKILELSGGEPLPDTVAFTSNRPGRCQYLFYVGEEYWKAIATKKLAVAWDEKGKPTEFLEFRWDGCQSVLPPSVHPQTGFYRWRKSPQEIQIAPAPMWIIEAMLDEPAADTSTKRYAQIKLPVAAIIPLATCLTHRSRDMLSTGGAAPDKGRNDSGAELARDLIGTANYLDSLGQQYEGNPEVSFFDWCRDCGLDSDKPKGQPQAIWKSASKANPKPGSGGEGVDACIRAHYWTNFLKTTGGRFSGSTASNCSKQNRSVTGDSRVSGDSQDSGTLSVAATVTSVTEILKSGFPDWLEINKLEFVRVNSELSHKQAFQALVSGIKSQLDEVQPGDEVRLQSLIDWHNAKLDFHQALPSMAADILHDAEILNIDPIGIWQYLLPAVLSLAGKRVNLSLESHEIPAVVWTGVIAESGTGKTRAEKLVTSPLKRLQMQARECFIAKLEEWEQKVANWKEDDGKKPPKPVERKYLFDVATIQAVLRRQAEQGLNGSLWARDELIGIFQSFGQFNKGENEALSCLLTSWDGGSTQVDRVSQEDSYIIDSSRLSIAGGLQPGVFKKIFKDPADSQGLQARFLFAAMKPKKPKRVKGFCHLSEKLPPMYQWLDTLPQGEIKLSIEADRYYNKLYEVIGEQAFNTSMPAVRAWMFKLPGQLLRIALGLHLIECYHDHNRPLWTLQKDTLERAVLFAQYYRSTFHVVQTTAADTDDISAILLQIWDKAITRHPEGISTRDAYRDIKAIQYRAKDAGRPVAAYTADLFGKLEQMEKGSVVKDGRLIKFVANLTPPPTSPDKNDWLKTKSPTSGDRVTVAETLDTSTSEVSPADEVSPVTVSNYEAVDVLQTEVPKEELPEKTTSKPTANPQLQFATLTAFLEILEAHTEPYFEREVLIATVAEMCAFEESWEGIKATMKAAELSDEERLEVGRRWDELGHGAKTRQLYKQYLQKASQPEVVFEKGDRVQYSHWYGTLAAHVKGGWLVQWDKLSKSCAKKHGEIPANAKHPLKEVDLKLISKATHG